jgi:hypothetical protein
MLKSNAGFGLPHLLSAATAVGSLIAIISSELFSL